MGHQSFNEFQADWAKRDAQDFRPRPFRPRDLEAVCAACDTLVRVDGRFSGELDEIRCEHCGAHELVGA